MTTSRLRCRGRTWAAAVLCLALATAAPACRGDRGGGAEANVRRYTLRGELVRVPASPAAPRQVLLRHEAIPDFVDASGKAVGMAPMTMAFEVAPSAPLDTLRPGDKVEVTLAVGWSPPLLRIEQVRKLPDDTALKLGR